MAVDCLNWRSGLEYDEVDLEIVSVKGRLK